MIRSYSVIVPVFNKAQEIVRTLQSVDDSMRHFEAVHPDAHRVEGEVIVVDDGSTDDTIKNVRAFIASRPRYQLLCHSRSLGAGPARNTGANLARGDLLYYCDGDDLFLQGHILLCYLVLSHNPVPGAPATHYKLQVRDRLISLILPNYPVVCVRTGALMRDPVLPHWKAAVENTIPQNLCLRRGCHDFIEGFPVATPYKWYGCEDVAYNSWLRLFFKMLKIEIETVEYIRYPGNAYDRQMEKFRTPPERWVEKMNDDQLNYHRIRERLEQERAVYLLEKFRTFVKPDVPVAALNWHRLVGALLAASQDRDAIALYEQGIAIEPLGSPELARGLALAYQRLGLAVPVSLI
jgi:glycosyltransferase involved in cell wall biosynthesis